MVEVEVGGLTVVEDGSDVVGGAVEVDVGGEVEVDEFSPKGAQLLGRPEVRLKTSLAVPRVTSKVARRERVDPILVVTE